MRYQTDGMQTTSPQRLLTLLYERLLRDIDDAAAAIGAGAVERAHDALVHAQDIVLEFQLALDIDGFEGAEALADLYNYLTDRLVTANRFKSPSVVAECRSIVAPLAEAFTAAADQPEQGSPVPAAPATV